MPFSRTRHGQIRYDHGSETLQLMVIDVHEQRSVVPEPRRISFDRVQDVCGSYWDFINKNVTRLAVTAEMEGLKMFIDDLITRSSSLCDELLSDQMKSELWSVAEEAEQLIILTDLLQIPWEALYVGDMVHGSFLSDNCVTIRVPPDMSGHKRAFPNEGTDFRKERIIFFDPEIDNMIKLEAEGCCSDILKSSYGREFCITGLKSELASAVQGIRAVHWICHHAKDGLRLRNGVYYCPGDARIYRFAHRGVLFLTSCKAGAEMLGEGNIAAEISLASNCTVVAPSSLIEAGAGFAFLRKILERIDEAPAPLTVEQFWRSIRNANWRENPSIEACMSLWFGIYGNGKALIKGGTYGDTSGNSERGFCGDCK